jgi:hypothetical protein
MRIRGGGLGCDFWAVFVAELFSGLESVLVDLGYKTAPISINFDRLYFYDQTVFQSRCIVDAYRGFVALVLHAYGCTESPVSCNVRFDREYFQKLQFVSLQPSLKVLHMFLCHTWIHLRQVPDDR